MTREPPFTAALTDHMQFPDPTKAFAGASTILQQSGLNLAPPSPTMLSKASSSIQKRRQQHRRQNSLEVPTLTQHLPANHLRRNQAHHNHRRGLSLDHGMQRLSPGFRPMATQDYQPMVGMDTNTGHHQQQQYMQETQQHTPAQPGFMADSFQQHLQKQLNPPEFDELLMMNTQDAPAKPSRDLERERDLINLQEHIRRVQEKHGSVLTHMPTTPTFTRSQLVIPEMPTTPHHNMSEMPMAPQHNMPQHSMAGMPHTPTSQSRTLPSTPQHTYWPSPPPTHAKHARSQSYQFDVAPMPTATSFGEVPVLTVDQSPFTTQQDSFNQDVFNGANDNVYASSSYASSVVDAMSPNHNVSQQSQPMPTVFEEDASSPLNHLTQQHGLSQNDMIFETASGAEQDMDMYFDGPMTERDLALRNIGDIDASIEDTGISTEEVQSFISPQDPETSRWSCMWPGCDKDFGRKENIRSHVQTHLGDRAFKCNACGSKFVRQHDLKRHGRIHTGSKPHRCVCGSGFARHDALTRHRQRGCCAGALPGVERKEVKRGRPRKEQPDATTRLNKASRARVIDAQTAAAVHYASSSSGASEQSLPVTPDTGNHYRAHAFVDMTDFDSNVGASTNSWHDTPPTSPVSASPDNTGADTSFTLPCTQDIFDPSAGVAPGDLSNASSPANAATPPMASDDLPSMANTTVFNDMNNFLSQDPFSPEGYSSSSDSDFELLLKGTANDGIGDFVNFDADSFIITADRDVQAWK